MKKTIKSSYSVSHFYRQMWRESDNKEQTDKCVILHSVVL